MTRLILVRHGELDKPLDLAQEKIDPSDSWQLSERGIEQVRTAGEYLRKHNLIESDNVEAIVGDQARLRQSAYELGEFSPELRFYVERYLNGRQRKSAVINDPSEILIAQANPTDESFDRFMSRGPERLLDRIRRKLNTVNDFLIVTSREMIAGLRFRLRGTPKEERIQALKAFSYDNDDKFGTEYDVAPGAIVIFQNELPPVENLNSNSRASFRHEMVIDPSNPELDTDWRSFKVRTYARNELWGEGSRGLFESC